VKIAVFSIKPYDRLFFNQVNMNFLHDITFLEPRLSLETAPLAVGYPVVCVFVNDQLDAAVLERLAQQGIVMVALRCAGYNNVDLETAAALGITVARVPAYSPYAVAEHTIGLMMALNRKIHRAYNRVREGNFSLDGLLGFDVHGKTIGIIGTGKIGQVVTRILDGFDCNLLAFDPYPDKALETQFNLCYTTLADIYSQSDIITLHCPLTPETRHLIDEPAVNQMKENVMIINTGRGALIDTQAVIKGLKSGKIGYLGLDVYEEEAGLFFEDLSCEVIKDDLFARLLTFPNVIITGHQAFFTKEAMKNIAETTLANITEFEKKHCCTNQVLLSR
jgi:D-lactate dehydrogenase